MKVVAMTVCCVDVYRESGQEAVECVGGNALNFATQCVKSKAEKVAVLGAVGNERYGGLVRQYLEQSGIDISHLYTQIGNTATNRILLDPSGERYFLPDSWDGGVYQTFRLTKADWDFVYTHDAAAITAFDPNFATVLEQKRQTHKWIVDFLDTREIERVQQAIPVIDIGFISGERNTLEQVRSLAEKENNAVIVVTLGSQGSIALWRGKEYYQPAQPVAKVVDTTGCGDAYQAAFSVSYLRNGSIEAAMQAGVLAASQVLTHLGGVEWDQGRI